MNRKTAALPRAKRPLEATADGVDCGIWSATDWGDMGDLEDSIRRQNEQRDAEWKYRDPVTIGDGVATGFFVGADVHESVKVQITKSLRPDLFVVGRVYEIPNEEAHREKA